MAGARVSVIVPAHNEGDNLAATVDCLVAGIDAAHAEVIVVDDGSTDGSIDRLDRSGDRPMTVVRDHGLGVAGARNRGAAAASGDVLVFLDAHCYTAPGWTDGLVEALARPEVGLVGPRVGSVVDGRHGPFGCGMTFADASLTPAWLPPEPPDGRPGPYAVPMVPGMCQAIRRADFAALGGYDAGMTRWGSEDLELSLRVALAGSDVVVDPASCIYHLFRPSHPYRVDVAGILHNVLRLALVHFDLERFARVVDRYRSWPCFPDALALLLAGDALARRAHWREVRRRDDDWFCERFDCRI